MSKLKSIIQNPSLKKCQSQSHKFLLFTEKMYEGGVDEKGILRCEPEADEIIEIKCFECGKFYKTENFSDIEY